MSLKSPKTILEKWVAAYSGGMYHEYLSVKRMTKALHKKIDAANAELKTMQDRHALEIADERRRGIR